MIVCNYLGNIIEHACSTPSSLPRTHMEIPFSDDGYIDHCSTNSDWVHHWSGLRGAIQMG